MLNKDSTGLVMVDDVKNHIQKRCKCIVNKKPNIQEKAPLVPVVAQYPFEIIAIDFLKLDKCKGGFEYVLVVTDHFTRFAQAYESLLTYSISRLDISE